MEIQLTFKVFGTHTTQPFMKMRIFQMSTKWLTYLVIGFTMTSGNYKEVIDVLHERFGSKDVIISSHMDALLKLPLVYNSDTKRLRSVYDLIEQNIRGLKTLGISSKEYEQTSTRVQTNFNKKCSQR